MWSGEDGIVEDLEFVQDKYQSSMVQLHLLSEEEAKCVFGETDNLLKIHRSLRDNLVSLRDSAGITAGVGKTLMNWVGLLKIKNIIGNVKSTFKSHK